MADEGIKDFTVTWIIGGLLIFCLLNFATIFIYNNNVNSLDDGTGDIFSVSVSDYSNKLLLTSTSSDDILNITSNTNPEISDLGSRDSVAVAYNAGGSARNLWSSSKQLISFVFSGTTGKILLGTFGGIIGFLMVFFIWRFIKNGL